MKNRMMMKKKIYVRPEMEIIATGSEQLMAGSIIGEFDKTDANRYTIGVSNGDWGSDDVMYAPGMTFGCVWDED